MLLAESVVLIAANFLKKLLASDILHHKVDVLGIIIRLEVLDNIGMIQLVKRFNFLNDLLQVILLFLLKHFYRHLQALVVLVVGLENFTVLADAHHFGVDVDRVVLFELSDALLAIGFVLSQLLRAALGVSYFELWGREGVCTLALGEVCGFDACVFGLDLVLVVEAGSGAATLSHFGL